MNLLSLLLGTCILLVLPSKPFTFAASRRPTPVPTAHPTALPTAKPTYKPSPYPSTFPTPQPSASPSLSPTALPTSLNPQCSFSIDGAVYGIFNTKYDGLGIQSIILNNCNRSIIDKGMFKNNQLRRVRLPSNISRIEKNAFKNNPLEEVCYEGRKPPEYIGYRAFNGLCITPCYRNQDYDLLVYLSYPFGIARILFGVANRNSKNNFAYSSFCVICGFLLLCISLGMYFDRRAYLPFNRNVNHTQNQICTIGKSPNILLMLISIAPFLIIPFELVQGVYMASVSIFTGIILDNIAYVATGACVCAIILLFYMGILVDPYAAKNISGYFNLWLLFTVKIMIIPHSFWCTLLPNLHIANEIFLPTHFTTPSGIHKTVFSESEPFYLSTRDVFLYPGLAFYCISSYFATLLPSIFSRMGFGELLFVRVASYCYIKIEDLVESFIPVSVFVATLLNLLYLATIPALIVINFITAKPISIIRKLAPSYEDPLDAIKATDPGADSQSDNMSTAKFEWKNMIRSVILSLLTVLDFSTDCLFARQVQKSMLYTGNHSKYLFERSIFILSATFLIVPMYINGCILVAIGDFRVYFEGILTYLPDTRIFVMYVDFMFEFVDQKLLQSRQYFNEVTAYWKIISIDSFKFGYEPTKSSDTPTELDTIADEEEALVFQNVHFMIEGVNSYSKAVNEYVSCDFEISDSKAGYFELQVLTSYQKWWFWHGEGTPISDDSKVIQAFFFYLYPIHYIMCKLLWILTLAASLIVIGASYTIKLISLSTAFSFQNAVQSIVRLSVYAYGGVSFVIANSLFFSVYSMLQAIKFSLLFVVYLVNASFVGIVYFVLYFTCFVLNVTILAVALTNGELLYELYGVRKYQFATTALGILVEDIPQLIIQLSFSIVMAVKYGASLSGLQIASFVVTMWHLGFGFTLKYMTKSKPAEKWILNSLEVFTAVSNVA